MQHRKWYFARSPATRVTPTLICTQIRRIRNGLAREKKTNQRPLPFFVCYFYTRNSRVSISDSFLRISTLRSSRPAGRPTTTAHRCVGCTISHSFWSPGELLTAWTKQTASAKSNRKIQMFTTKWIRDVAAKWMLQDVGVQMTSLHVLRWQNGDKIISAPHARCPIKGCRPTEPCSKRPRAIQIEELNLELKTILYKHLIYCWNLLILPNARESCILLRAFAGNLFGLVFYMLHKYVAMIFFCLCKAALVGSHRECFGMANDK